MTAKPQADVSSSQTASIPAGSAGALFIIMAAVLWGTTGTAQALAPDAAQPAAIGALRLLLGGLGLLVLASVRGTLVGHKTWAIPVVVVGSVSVAAYQLSFFGGVARTGVAVGTIVGIGSAPVMGGFLAYLVRGEQLSRRWFAATGLAILGCVLLVGSGGDIGVDPLGVLLSLGAGLSYAIYTLASKRLLEDHAPDAVMAVFFCAGAILLLPVLLSHDLGWLPEASGILTMLHLGFIATTLSYVLFARGLRYVPASTAVTLSLAEPLTAGLLGVIVVGETLTAVGLIGIGLLFSGLFILTRAPRHRDQK